MPITGTGEATSEELTSDRNTQRASGRTAQETARRRSVYAKIIRQYEGSLLRAAKRLCAGQEDRAQDMVQDALIRGYEAFLDGRFEEGTNARAWLLRILTNLFLVDYRKRKRWEADVDLDTLTAGGETGPVCMQAGTADVPDLALLESVLDEPLERALAALPPRTARLCDAGGC